MSRLTQSDRDRVRRIAGDLDALSVGRQSTFDVIVSMIGDLLGVAKVGATSLRTDGERVRVDETRGIGFDAATFRALSDRLFALQPDGWMLVDPLCPNPEYRNRVLLRGELDEALARGARHGAFVSRVLGPLGLDGYDHLCACICDGPSLLAWIDAWQADPFEPRQRRMLAALLPALQRSLKVERRLRAVPRTAAALEAALDAVGAAALVASSDGRIFEANRAARAWLERDRAGAIRALHAAIARPGSSETFDITPLKSGGDARYVLAVVRADAHEVALSKAVGRMISCWNLTHREAEVLDLVARGMTNAAMASLLGVCEATVEFHLSKLFDKAGAESRAALVARLLTP